MSWNAALHPPDAVAIAALALAIEAATGYPDRLYRWVGHPVTWIGRGIEWLDRSLNRGGPARRCLAGVATLLLILVVVGAAATALTAVCGSAGRYTGTILVGFLAASLPAQRSLHTHVADVAGGLRLTGVEGGRAAVAMIVGRNPKSLDEPAICRAAIESLAENFSDGIVAPAFWTAVAGLPGGALYKAVNTADSMIGHRTARLEAFGWAAARLDDLVNLPASRLSAGLIIAAAVFHPDASAGGAWNAVRRDAGRHRSPNAGWPEAAMAGALGLRLAGPRVYGDALVEDAWIGDGRMAVVPADIERALSLYRTACVILLSMLTACASVMLG